MSIVRVASRPLVVITAFVAGAFAVAACQGVTGTPRDAAAGFMAANDYGVHFVDTGETAKLAYGRENSEVMSLMLECAKGSGAVEVTDVARGATRLSLTSAGQRMDLSGEIAASPMAPIFIAQARASSPALKAFRQTGKVQVVNGALTYDVAAKGAEKSSVERFFAACEQSA